MADYLDQTVPQNAESPTLGALRIRETREAFNTVFGTEHDKSDDAQTSGFHGTNVTGKADTAITDPPSGYGRFGWKVVSGTTELFYRDDAGNEAQITEQGIVKGNPVGSGMEFYGATAPDGWLFCDASAVSRTTYSALFAVIGTTYGAGDGSTTFNLPDMRGRVPLGVGTGDASDATAHALADKEGTESHTLITGEMPAHTHGVSNTGQNIGTGGTYFGASAGNDKLSNSTGGGGAHNNLQPSLTVNFIIKY